MGRANSPWTGLACGSLTVDRGMWSGGQVARLREWAVLLGGDIMRRPLSYLQRCGTAGKSLYRGHRAAGRGSRGTACLCCWALLSSPALCLDPVLQHHWWRCKWESRSAAASLRGQMLFFRLARDCSVSFQKTLQRKREMGISVSVLLLNTRARDSYSISLDPRERPHRSTLTSQQCMLGP